MRMGRRWTVATIVVCLTLAAACSSDEPVGNGSGSSSTSEAAQVADLNALVEESGFGDPDAVELPGPDDANPVVAWLEGEGSPAVALVIDSERLWSEGMAACEAVAEELDANTPEEVVAAASSTPDEVTSEILVGLHTATGAALGACADAATFEIAVAELAWQWALADRRLDELGVER